MPADDEDSDAAILARRSEAAPERHDEAHEEDDPSVERVAKRAAAHLMRLSFRFSGPIPHPGMLAGYDKVVPGAADRLIRMTERGQEFRHDTERKMIDNDIGRSRNGQWFAFIIALLL